MRLIVILTMPLFLFACSSEDDANSPTPKAVQSVQNNRFSSVKTVYRFDALIARIGRQERVDPRLIHAIVRQESSYNPRAVSSKGAAGLMQLMPATALDYGLARHELFDVAKNLRAGAQHVRKLMKMFNGNITLVLAAYNAGQGNVIKYGYKVPPFKETHNYVSRVKGYYANFVRSTLLSPVTRPVTPHSARIINTQTRDVGRGT